MAEQAGFDALWISDHFHPWLDEQGQSSFGWSVIGAISQVADLPITTAVTCPTTRIHPAIIAQATHRGRHSGGDRPGYGIKGCWAPDAGLARRTMRRLWPNDFIPGESAQLLPLPRHFAQLTQLVTEDMVTAPYGPDPQPYIDAIRAHEEAGSDEVYLGQVGGRLEEAFEFYSSTLLPHARER